jgi:hypothetical protein
MRLLICAGVSALLIGSSVLCSDIDWPIIAPLQRAFSFSDGENAALDVDIDSTRGDTVYHLRCRTYRSQDDVDFEYSGDFECRLFSPHSDDWRSRWNLLSDVPEYKDRSRYRDWDHRGRFLGLELAAQCLGYPGYGASRVFELRGMRLTLAIHDFALATASSKETRRPTPAIRSFQFTVRARSVPSIRSPYARRAHYEAPECVRGDDRHDTWCVALDCQHPRRRH